eukprot:TRINITY_DN984_c0_g1_i2.p1 TRINITY_DN984_c0_g1~~TRINITY_DN984_c0_g1_i2.p1  ORF type:complete len:362 (-),score=56.91 TRINITY_DN984_c0_g1_i2:455-1540(-)
MQAMTTVCALQPFKIETRFLGNLNSCFAERDYSLSFRISRKLFNGNNKSRSIDVVSCKARRSDDISELLRGESLHDELIENQTNIIDDEIGFDPPLLQLFSSEYSVMQQAAEKATEESSLPSENKVSTSNLLARNINSSITMSANKYHYGGMDSPNPPPDIPSLFLDANVVFLFGTLDPFASDLIIAQFLYLNSCRRGKPLFFYINSTGTKSEMYEPVALSTDAFAIADILLADQSREIHTVNIGFALREAGMLLTLGTKGYRFVGTQTITSLELPQSYGEFGTSVDLLGMAQDLEMMTKTYVKYVASGTGKTEKQILSDVCGQKLFEAQEAVDYGIADIIMIHDPSRYDEFFPKADDIFL